MINLAVKLKLTFSEWFKISRGRAGLSQAAVAAKLGVKTQTIYNWESNTTKPKLDPWQTWVLCETLGVTLKQLAEGFKGEGGDD
ncbi:helix-turn-helix transcriptional regulator [Acaryochloris sp. IP29b_bin.148]|uniref:helix-turn-helix transcriptional regulator n=1 Tax=Acaryochloris sp. IP29b_bin.148 TaxID=2969218 RepID=UPI00260529E2|nr:helix-turn-helix transcriptional regulator [Acaryochloris sp. IP29b_bin.148]